MAKLNDVEFQRPNYIPDKNAEQIMGALDKWINEVERFCKSHMDLADLMPGHDQLIAECFDSIALVKKFRSSIQSAEQSWWALAMLYAVETERLALTSVHKLELYSKPARARWQKEIKELGRVDWLNKRIEERELTAKDLLGSGRHPKRTELFDEYHEQFDKKSKTFTADVKTIFDLAE